MLIFGKDGFGTLEPNEYNRFVKTYFGRVGEHVRMCLFSLPYACIHVNIFF